MKLFLMNSAVMPVPGQYFLEAMSREAWVERILARKAAGAEICSAIGYRQNAEMLSEWLGIPVRESRDPVEFLDGDEGAVMRLRYRVADPRKKGAPVDPEDFEFLWVSYMGVAF